MPKTKPEEIKKGDIIIYKSKDGPSLEVRLKEDSVWLTQNQIASLFDVQKAAISKHIRNIFQSGELEEKSTVSKMETVQIEGNRKITRELTYYNLDMIISVGYRVNSQKATQFRIWATKTLKDYLIKGYSINEKRLLSARNNFNELTETIEFLKNKAKHELLAGQEQEILSLLSDYSKSLSLLEQYDKDKLSIRKKERERYKIDYHYYIPIIISDSEKLNYLTHIIKVRSEVKFLSALEEYLEKKDNLFKQFDWWMFSKIDETIDDVYIPYYDPKVNSLSKYKPDFIFWLLKKDNYKIIFVDPKGTEFSSYQHKVDGFKRIFEDKVMIQDNLKIDVLLKLFTLDKAKVPEGYRDYWFDNVNGLFN